MITVPSPSSSPGSDSKKTLAYNLVVIYENATTGKRANHFCEQLVEELGETPLGIKDLWSFGVLGIPEVRQEAAEAAGRADAVILALDGHGGLPEGVKAWMKEWIGQTAGRSVERSPILIALFGALDDGPEVADSARAYLGGIAETSGLTFMHTLRRTPAEELRLGGPYG